MQGKKPLVQQSIGNTNIEKRSGIISVLSLISEQQLDNLKINGITYVILTFSH